MKKRVYAGSALSVCVSFMRPQGDCRMRGGCSSARARSAGAGGGKDEQQSELGQGHLVLLNHGLACAVLSPQRLGVRPFAVAVVVRDHRARRRDLRDEALVPPHSLRTVYSRYDALKKHPARGRDLCPASEPGLSGAQSEGVSKCIRERVLATAPIRGYARSYL